MTVRFVKTFGGPPFTAFRGQFTFVNHGSAPVSGWVLWASFAGDVFDWVYNGPPGGGPFMDSQTQHGFLILRATRSETIPAGGQLTVLVQAEGRTLSPLSCSFDGTSC
ncbi:MAG TPA: hypothetical protein VGS19_32545 [Streptosporangiaceae bacterium]|nr:hypothetical protein [Streptosporangiaceae bacterium]